MINYNGTLTAETKLELVDNRAFLYGDSVFETLKVLDGRILFLEEHYFRLMASMRIVRMEIPMTFTMEYMEQQVFALTNSLNINNSARVRFSFFRRPGGYYLPLDNATEFIVTATHLPEQLYRVDQAQYEVDIYKDFHVSKHLLSTLKTANKMVHITGSIYANENGLQNCFLINDDKNVTEALQGNLFMLLEGKLITPPLSDGCLNGIMRKQVLALSKKIDGIEVVERSVSPFDLQKADELFITNVIMGIQPITKYRKKYYTGSLSAELVKRLNAQIRIG